MSDDLSFEDEIQRLEAQLEREKDNLKSLEDTLNNFDQKAERCRAHLARLRQLNRGEIPGSTSPADGRDIEQVEKDPDSGRPPRGARREQIRTICERIGGDGRAFRTREVLDRLAEVEQELTDGMKSYAYTVMDELRDDGVVEKVGWGQWELRGR